MRYLQMLNLRNAQKFSVWPGGSILDHHSQWQTYFWFTKQKYLEIGNDITICEIGMGPGYSSAMFLVATTSGDWKNGGILHQFDNGFDSWSMYGPRKRTAFPFLNETFGLPI